MLQKNKAWFACFIYALAGLSYVYRTQHNMKLHLLALIFVVGLSFWLQISSCEWLFVILMIGLVMAAEVFNTAIEKIMDVYTLEYDPLVKVVKDVSAGGVLVLSVMALLVGIIIFLPKLLAV